MLPRLLFATLVALTVMPAHASLRCGQQLVDEGDDTVRVRERCGEPDQREVHPPAARMGANRAFQAVEEQVWTYGPQNGATRVLRFLDGRLVEIRTSR